MHRRIVLISSVLLVAAVAVTTFFTRDLWQPLLSTQKKQETEDAKAAGHSHGEDDDHIDLSPQAQASLGIVAGRLELASYPRSLEVPGEVVELPGHSDHIITAPASGVIRQIAYGPWQTVRPGEKLFTIGLVSEFVQSSQTALFKATRELAGARKQRAMLEERSSVVPAAKLLELDLLEQRLQAAIDSHRFELAARGLRPEDIDRAARGDFIKELDIHAPRSVEAVSASPEVSDIFEIQELKVNRGQMVQAGQQLCLLTDHRHLVIEGHAFRDELPLVEQAAREGTALGAEWLGKQSKDWPTYPGQLRISGLANITEAEHQLVPFHVPLVNQHRDYTRDGKHFRQWRFRPGQRVRLHIPLEEIRDVYVLPRTAVVRDGVEHYIFRQNGDAFERRPVRIVYEDRRHFVIAPDSIGKRDHVVLTAAQALNRALKTRGGEGEEHHHHH